MWRRLADSFRTRITEHNISELLRGGATNLSIFVVGRLIGVAFVVAVSRLHGAATYGAFALSLTCLVIFSVLGRCGLNIALLRLVAQLAAQGKMGAVKDVFIKAFAVATPIAVLFAMILYMASEQIAETVFGKNDLGLHFRIMAFALVPHVWHQLFVESLRGLKKIFAYSLLADVSPFLIAGLALAALEPTTDSVAVPAISYVIGVTISCVFSAAVWVRTSGFLRVRATGDVKLRELVAIAFPLLLGTSMVLLMNWTDNVMLGMFGTEVDVGIYDVVFRLSMIAGATLQAVNSIAAPKFAECFGARDLDGLREIAVGSTRLIFWSTLPILLLCVAKPRLPLGLFGAQFEVGATALIILLAGTFLSAISGSVGFILRMTGKEKAFQNIIAVAAIINIALNAILIPRYGINGAATASFSSLVFWNVASVYMVHRYYGFYTIYFPFSRYILRA